MLRRALPFLTLPFLRLPALAQGWSPTGPIRVVLPQTPGSSGDTVVRQMSDVLARELGQPILVDNRPGANGAVAGAFVKNARPDGQTLLMAGVSMVAFNQHLYRSLPYDPVRDFSWIAPMTNTAFVVIASKASGITTIAQLVERAKAEPGRLTFSSAGIANTTHLAMEMLAERAGIGLTHVPYAGSPQALTAVAAGQVDCMVSVLGLALQLIRGGQVVPLASVRETRAAVLPDLPTLREAGVDAPVIPGWFALCGPAGMSEAAVNRINAAVRVGLEDATIQRQLAAADLEPLIGSPADIRTRLENDSRVWGDFIRARGLRLE